MKKTLIGIAVLIVSQVILPQSYTWTQVGTVVHYPVGSFYGDIFVDSSNHLINWRSTVDPFYRSTDNGTTWSVATNVNLNSLWSYIFFMDVEGDGVRTRDWRVTRNNVQTQVTYAYFYTNIVDFVRSEYLNRVFALGDSGKVFHAEPPLKYSNDSGATWFAVDVYDEANYTIAEFWNNTTARTYYYNQYVTSVVTDSIHNIMASTKGKGIFYSVNNGNSWIQQNSGLTDTVIVTLMTDTSDNVYAVSQSGKIFKGTLNPNGPLPVVLNFFKCIPGEHSMLLQWETAMEVGSFGFEIEKKMVAGSHMNDWEKIGTVQGAGTSAITNLYSYTDDDVLNGKVRYRLKQIDVDGTVRYLSDIETEGLPVGFSLSQNFPNPFNPSTRIRFSIPTDAKVSLKVTDLLGREVATLVEGFHSAGTHNVEWNGSGFPSGLYFYRIQAGKRSETRRMFLLK